MLMVVSAMFVNAQSLTGKQWCTVLNDEDGQPLALAITYQTNGTCEVIFASEQEMKEDGVPITMYAQVTIPGTYQLNGKDLKMNLEKGKAQSDVDYEIKGMDAKTKAKMENVIGSEVESMKKEFKKIILDGMPKMGNMTVVKLESKRLILKNDDGHEIPFYVE